MIKKLSLLPLFLAGFCFSQGDADIFKYSKTETFGSARFEAMGGSFGALGADFGSSQINPAGFGRFSSSQANMSLGVLNIKNTTSFQGVSTSETKNSFKPNSIGVVLVQDESLKQEGIQYVQIGFGFNRLQNFNSNFKYEGQQFESLLDVFAASAQGVPFEYLYETHPFSSSLAWETYTIDPSGNPNEYVPALYNQGDQYHIRTIETTGGMNEYYASLSANYMNVLYFGANVGLRTINYEEDLNHTEIVMDTTGNDLRSFNYNYNLKTKGSGANLKLGVIYLPKDNIRLGIAFHTPTYYELTDDTKADMTAEFESGTKTIAEDLKPIGNYKYRLRTPPRLVGSAAYIFGTRGCLNLDLEYVNYKWGNLKSTTDLENYAEYNFNNENEIINSVFQSALNMKLGGELVLNSVFFLRGGIGLSSMAYNESVRVENSWDKSISAGLGYRVNQFAFNLGVSRSSFSRVYTAFAGSSAEQSILKTAFTFDFTYIID